MKTLLLSHIVTAKISGFKSVNNASILLRKDLNIIIGENASGKSNLLNAIQNCFQTFLNGYVPEKDTEFILEMSVSDLTASTDNSNKIETNIKYTFSSKQFQAKDTFEDYNTIEQKLYILGSSYSKEEIVNSAQKTFVPILKSEKVNTSVNVFPKTIYKIDFGSTPEINYLSEPGSVIITKMSSIKFVRKPTYKTLIALESNLAGAIFRGFADHKDKSILLAKINAGIKKLEQFIVKASNVRKIRVSDSLKYEEDNDKIVVSDVVLEFYTNGSWFQWAQLSDGTKRAIYIILTLCRGGSIVLIEEPELGLYPHQLHKLMSFIVERSASNQIIVTTHSPLILDFVNINSLDSVNIAKHKGKLGTKIAKLTEDQIEDIKKYMNNIGPLSEYWINTDNLLK